MADIFDYTGNKIYEEATSEAKEYIEDKIQTYLMELGYERDHAEAILDFIRSENNYMDYSKILDDIPESNPMYAKLADVEIFDKLEKLSKFQENCTKLKEYYDVSVRLQTSINADENIDKDDARELLEKALGDVSSQISKIVPTGFFYDYIS
jgi:excinuclease UvrABC nuclease subunit